MTELRLGAEADFPTALKAHPGLGAFGVGRELRNLAGMLSPDEFVLDLIQGAYANQTGLLIRTTKRVMFFAKGLVTTKVEEFSLDKITSVQYTTGLMLGEITLFASGNKAEIKSTIKAYTKPFVDALRSQLESGTLLSRPGRDSQESTGALVELERLAGMKERGLLTDEEFTAAKRKVLGL